MEAYRRTMARVDWRAAADYVGGVTLDKPTSLPDLTNLCSREFEYTKSHSEEWLEL
ncbi:hypothetical protein [Paenibacillus radicis (ex Xue et al. 2023)]|uniref:Uncharacterized protein n=1 Tax=Paenibacillus radicis (ex Xue et al. 2023) TaxID=2972489 RepID=A0ABT1YGC4_9BACL|nr:hypothetical protein [Paenibacillus radicis (ex Xue et al. 2023)]MCR8632253.1 hypothetical protein [Paenibacillus radicis (ex Xue et al. 2023)]